MRMHLCLSAGAFVYNFPLRYTYSEVKVSQSCLTLCDPVDCIVHGDSPGQSTGEGSRSLLQGIFPTQGSNPGIPHCRRILYQLSHQGTPGILEWVAYPFSSGSSRPRNWTGASCIAGRFIPNWAMREAPALNMVQVKLSDSKHGEG